MEQARSSEMVRIAFIPTERDWLMRIRESDHAVPDVSFGPASLDPEVLAQTEIVLFDATAPEYLIDFLAVRGVVTVQLAGPVDRVNPLAYFYLPDTIALEVLIQRAYSAYISRFQPKRVVGLLGAVGGAGLTEIALTLATQWVREGLPTLIVDAGPHPGDISVRMGLHNAATHPAHQLQRVDPEELFWLHTITASAEAPEDLGQALPHIALKRIVVDMGTIARPGVIGRLDDLVVVTRPTPGGIQRCMRLATHYPEMTVALSGQPVGPAVTALSVLTRRMPGQVHRLPAVDHAVQRAWNGRALDDPVWLGAIARLLPPHSSFKRLAA